MPTGTATTASTRYRYRHAARPGRAPWDSWPPRKNVKRRRGSAANDPEDDLSAREEMPAAVAEPSILIVDDDARSRMALQELLQMPGRTAIVAGSGEEALRRVLQQEFAAIIMDVQMPGMDGFETARFIRDRERSRHTPIIFLTGAFDGDSVFRGYEAGAVDYIVKPPNPDVLQSKVAVFVELYNKNALLRREVAERKLALQQLRTSEQNLRALATHLQSVREEERARISREIHDELGQELTGVKMQLKWIAQRLPKTNKALHEKAESTLALVDQTIQSVRKIASGLRPALTEQLGLADAIDWQVKDFRKRSGLRCRLSLPVEMPALDQEQSTAMFRICQELLTNVARHAEATRAEVTVRVAENKLCLSVEDNGKGIGDAPVSGPKALGYLGMRERIRPFGGTIDIDRERAVGAKVTAVLPLD